jgi:alkanesulfonate monooxygenase SsuD/methylene tetrahydromethanopterin reductase-like flavin-dependent oxidoreductase (luciferase family)
MQDSLPIWLGVGGTPKSFARAGALGLPLMVAIIGGEPRRFRPLIDLYRETGRQHGHSADKPEGDDGCRQGARWPPMTRASFDAQRGPDGALLIGSPHEVVDKILRHAEALGGISRISFQMNVASLPQAKMMRAIDAIGAGVAPTLHQADPTRTTRARSTATTLEPSCSASSVC